MGMVCWTPQSWFFLELTFSRVFSSSVIKRTRHSCVTKQHNALHRASIDGSLLAVAELDKCELINLIGIKATTPHNLPLVRVRVKDAVDLIELEIDGGKGSPRSAFD